MGWQPGCVLLRGIVLLTFSFHYFVLGSLPSSAKFYTIHWNSSNPIFRIDNTDNIIDVNRNNMKFEYDQVNLICPVYTPGTRDEEMEKYIIYNVSKDEYETCRITNPNPRIIAVCDKPYKLMYFTITFRPFTPQPGGLEFLPGHDYYFISTSTSDDLHRRIGGRCTTSNMKIVFKVWGPPPMPATSQPPQATKSWWPVTSQQRTTTTSTSTTTSTEAPPPTTTKKSKTYNKHPNEVVKSEELTLGGGAAAPSSASLHCSMVLCAVLALVFTMR
ncbi:ephrin-A4 [Aethina tumida]|uniref:ephrin-A4 n=1 Tax=Aethina tumida TaxID=116153 RepID=UPI00096B0C16|nr:ephrin-A4 [Aethina tumida]XP_019881923.1 ephrin-A4 [Aethina tumida]XP_019881924.1 ephrin-A4 [Aethina tumida]XP_049818176.1 ephrin-A4 [Aethina tumida]XP_049818177.1 ephrin-A4 [Aethina tumida]XP_049818178.1 ephrin-A4 [Aethina tumida]